MNPRTKLIKEIADFHNENPEATPNDAFHYIVNKHDSLMSENFPKQQNSQPKPQQFKKLYTQVLTDLEIPLHRAMHELKFETEDLCDKLVESLQNITPENFAECREMQDAMLKLASAQNDRMIKNAVEDVIEILKLKERFTSDLQEQYELVYPKDQNE